MSTSNSTAIYTGTWVNWSEGLVFGSTITVSARNGGVLTAFIATFVTIVGAQLWKILCFIFHQSRASQAPQDGLYHQHQNVFRNSVSAGSAAWSFMLQSWHWSGRARHALMRSLPWMLFSMAYLIVFAVLSVFGSSEVAKAAGPDRLIKGTQCGYWQSNGTEIGQRSFEAKVLVDSQNAATYARNCYVQPVDDLNCNKYATPHLMHQGSDADCPFKDDICYKNHVYRMDTGFMDSHHDLGINTPVQDRLKYRRVATCSVLVEKAYINVSDTSAIVTWNYGPAIGESYSFSYSKYAVRSSIGYTVGTLYSNVGEPSFWEPTPALNRTDADVHLVYVAGNSILYTNPVDDPIFAAHLVSNITTMNVEGQEAIYYESDSYAGVLACAEQHQVCHGDTCTELSGRVPVFSSLRGLTLVQKGIFQRIAFASIFTATSQVINGRSGTSLRASDTVIGIRNGGLPSDQWKTETSSWFNTGLAILQHVMRDFVSPSNLRPGIFVEVPRDPVDESMCRNQKTQVTNGTISFSVLGLGVLLIAGTLIILVSFVLESIVGWLGPSSFLNWTLDDTVQLQRMVFETRGVSWASSAGHFPVTDAGQRFPSVAGLAESQSLMGGEEKGVRIHVREYS